MLTSASMLPTPDTSHVDTTQVYEPAEDSFLLLDVLSSAKETRYLQARLRTVPAPLIVEVGTGSGVVLAFLAAQAESIFAHASIFALGIDLNPAAVRAALQTGQRAAAQSVIDTLQGDLMSSVRPGTVDVLVFNPPYVPTEDVPAPEGTRDPLELAWAGGPDGMVVTRRFLSGAAAALSDAGVGYVVLCAQNRPADVLRALGHVGLHGDVVGRSGGTAGWEKLSIVRITRAR